MQNNYMLVPKACAALYHSDQVTEDRLDVHCGLQNLSKFQESLI